MQYKKIKNVYTSCFSIGSFINTYILSY